MLAIAALLITLASPATAEAPSTDPLGDWLANPTFTCESWQVPGWLGEDGKPTSCVDNAPCPEAREGLPCPGDLPAAIVPAPAPAPAPAPPVAAPAPIVAPVTPAKPQAAQTKPQPKPQAATPAAPAAPAAVVPSAPAKAPAVVLSEVPIKTLTPVTPFTPVVSEVPLDLLSSPANSPAPLIVAVASGLLLALAITFAIIRERRAERAQRAK